MDIQKHGREIQQFLQQGDFVETDEGLIIRSGIRARGKYTHDVNGEDVRVDYNLIPAEGMLFFLNVVLGDTAKPSGLYLAPFSGAVSPAANWTAANFAANASEITSADEGYSNATRQAWVPDGPAVGGVIGNVNNPAVFNIVCTTSINISGLAMLTSNVRGGTDGVLISASRFDSVRPVYNGDDFRAKYEVELTDS